MKKIRKIIIASVTIILLSVIVPAILPPRSTGLSILQGNIVYADNDSDVIELTENEKEIINEYDDNEIIDVNNMTVEQKEVFENMIIQAVAEMNLPTSEDEESTTNEIMDFFNSDTESYGDLEETTDNLHSRVNYNEECKKH